MNKKERLRRQKERMHRRFENEIKPAYEALMKCYPLTLDDLPGEEWKDFSEYHVSNFGRIKSFKSKKNTYP